VAIKEYGRPEEGLCELCGMNLVSKAGPIIRPNPTCFQQLPAHPICILRICIVGRCPSQYTPFIG
jgi:hypothetical protein